MHKFLLTAKIGESSAVLAGYCWLVHSWLFEDAVATAVLVHPLRSALELFSRTLLNNRQTRKEKILSPFIDIFSRVFLLLHINICALE